MTVLVVGDVMLDRYWFGDVNRISQEAPVPIVKFTREEYRAGAAANVAMNCATLGAQVSLLGIVGKDNSADILGKVLTTGGVASRLLVDESIKTTQKLRAIGRNQQIVRIDIEQKPVIGLDDEAKTEMPKHDIVVFSDYDKGALSGVSVLISCAKRLGKTVLVDPKGYDYTKYRGADLLKPNLDEMREMCGGWSREEQLAEKADKLRRDADIGAILLTRASDGMTLYDDSGAHHIPAKAMEVYDVTGAGDTVMAALAVMLERGKPLRLAAEVANRAAGIVVGRFGTATVTMDELGEFKE